MAETKKAIGKIKKKRWYEIVAPEVFRNTSLGETLVTEKERVIGKNLKVSLANIIGDMKRQSTIIKFRVARLKGDKAVADVIGYSILPTYLRRMIRRGRERVDDSFICKTKDNKQVRVKLFLITRSSAKNPVLTGLRKVGKEITTNAVKNMDYNNFVNDVVFFKLQKSLKEQLRKIFPLKLCEIRHFSLIEAKKEYVAEKKEINQERPLEKTENTVDAKKEEPKTGEKTEVKTEEKKPTEVKAEEHKDEPKQETKKSEEEIPKKGDEDAKTNN